MIFKLLKTVASKVARSFNTPHASLVLSSSPFLLFPLWPPDPSHHSSSPSSYISLFPGLLAATLAEFRSLPPLTPDILLASFSLKATSSSWPTMAYVIGPLATSPCSVPTTFPSHLWPLPFCCFFSSHTGLLVHP